jgi:hypothetical protein
VLAETVQPVVMLHDLSQSPASNYPSFRQAYIAALFAGNLFTLGWLTNPVGSGVMVRVKRIEISLQPGLGAIYNVFPANILNVTQKSFPTNVLGNVALTGIRSSQGQTSFQPNALLGGNGDWGMYIVLARTLLTILPNDMVLSPGSAVAFGNAVAGVIGDQHCVTLDWTEEPAVVPGVQ